MNTSDLWLSNSFGIIPYSAIVNFSSIHNLQYLSLLIFTASFYDFPFQYRIYTKVVFLLPIRNWTNYLYIYIFHVWSYFYDRNVFVWKGLQHYSFVCRQWSGYKYCNSILVIQFNITNLLYKEYFALNNPQGLICHKTTTYITYGGRVFANDMRDRGSIPGRLIPNTFKMVIDTSLLNTQQYKVFIEGKVEQSRERSSSLPYSSV